MIRRTVALSLLLVAQVADAQDAHPIYTAGTATAARGMAAMVFSPPCIAPPA